MSDEERETQMRAFFERLATHQVQLAEAAAKINGGQDAPACPGPSDLAERLQNLPRYAMLSSHRESADALLLDGVERTIIDAETDQWVKWADVSAAIEALKRPSVPHVPIPPAHQQAAQRFKAMFRPVPLDPAEQLPDPDHFAPTSSAAAARVAPVIAPPSDVKQHPIWLLANRIDEAMSGIEKSPDLNYAKGWTGAVNWLAAEIRGHLAREAAPPVVPSAEGDSNGKEEADGETGAANHRQPAQADRAVGATDEDCRTTGGLGVRPDDADRGELGRLRAAVLNQCGDNLCWVTDPDAVKALPEAEFLESCRRYHAQIATERGIAEGLPTIAQLEAENAKLRAAPPVVEGMQRLLRMFTAYRDAPMRDGSKSTIATIRRTLNVVVCEIEKELAAIAAPSGGGSTTRKTDG